MEIGDGSPVSNMKRKSSPGSPHRPSAKRTKKSGLQISSLPKSDKAQYWTTGGSRVNRGKFIKGVGAVLQQHEGVGTHTIRISYELCGRCAHHIDEWVEYTIASKAKGLILELRSAKFEPTVARYDFPLQMLDTKKNSNLRHLELHILSLSPPSDFRGFQNLTKLCLQDVNITNEDVQRLLSEGNHLEQRRIWAPGYTGHGLGREKNSWLTSRIRPGAQPSPAQLGLAFLSSLLAQARRATHGAVHSPRTRRDSRSPGPATGDGTAPLPPPSRPPWPPLPDLPPSGSSLRRSVDPRPPPTSPDSRIPPPGRKPRVAGSPPQLGFPIFPLFALP
ncbi:hypothetical protein ACQ4PT_001172 [Festuca glaucescens]